jgi:hypothetical protein
MPQVETRPVNPASSTSCADLFLYNSSPYGTALEDILPCAEQGYVEAIGHIGTLYQHGFDGAPVSYAEAVRWYRLAAEQGYGPSQYSLGEMYAHGRGLREDDVEALRWYRLAAEQKAYGGAYSYYLGEKYDKGNGLREDDTEAVRWYRSAAEQGHEDGQYQLGLMYQFGTGIPQDYVLASMWYNLAVAQGSENAQETQDILEQRMTREQIAEAQRLSREWIEAHPPGGN